MCRRTVTFLICPLHSHRFTRLPWLLIWSVEHFFYAPVFGYRLPPGKRCARRVTTAQMALLRRRLGAQLARLARCQEWSTSLAAGNANRATFACPGRLEFYLNSRIQTLLSSQHIKGLPAAGMAETALETSRSASSVLHNPLPDQQEPRATP